MTRGPALPSLKRRAHVALAWAPLWTFGATAGLDKPAKEGKPSRVKQPAAGPFDP